MKHLLHIVHAFRIMIQQLHCNLDPIVGVKLTDIGSVGFEGKKRRTGLEIVWSQSHQFKRLIAGAIKQNPVICHVEMAIIVYPVVFNCLDAANKGPSIIRHCVVRSKRARL